jgi:hypothetical protein
MSVAVIESELQKAPRLELLGDNALTWRNGEAFTAKLLGGGTAASPLTTGTANLKFIELRCESTATSGDNRLAYLRYALEGGGGGECLRGSTVVNSNVGTAHGAHFGIEFEAVAGASECSGLGVGLRGTLMIPNVTSWAPTGTYAAGMFEIFSEGSDSDPAGMTELACLRLENSGDGTGGDDVDTDAFILSLQGWTTAADATKNIRTDSLSELASGNVVGIRCKIGSGTYWIPAVPSASWN